VFLLSTIAFSILIIIAIFSLVRDLTKNEKKKDLLSSLLLLLTSIIVLFFSFVFLK